MYVYVFRKSYFAQKMNKIFVDQKENFFHTRNPVENEILRCRQKTYRFHQLTCLFQKNYEFCLRLDSTTL